MTGQDPDDTWMTTVDGIFIDIHSELRSFNDVLRFFRRVEQDFDRKEYCNGRNAGGRWIYQIYSKEFITDLTTLIHSIQSGNGNDGPILEVMAGDGRLTHFLQPLLSQRIIPTDAKTSRDGIEFPKGMEKVEALEAIRKHNPSLILMSWEPFYSDTSQSIIEKDVPFVWIGDPNSCAASSNIHQMEYDIHDSPFLLGRHDDFTRGEFRTAVRIFNRP
ncbi:MAG: hypothetical protein ACFFEJ_16550 [Candidatus Thorarchaeota archaeon]